MAKLEQMGREKERMAHDTGLLRSALDRGDQLRFALEQKIRELEAERARR
jgi:hypothetical protein